MLGVSTRQMPELAHTTSLQGLLASPMKELHRGPIQSRGQEQKLTKVQVPPCWQGPRSPQLEAPVSLSSSSHRGPVKGWRHRGHLTN